MILYAADCGRKEQKAKCRTEEVAAAVRELRKSKIVIMKKRCALFSNG
jgi:hypothetical protein